MYILYIYMYSVCTCTLCLCVTQSPTTFHQSCLSVNTVNYCNEIEKIAYSAKKHYSFTTLIKTTSISCSKELQKIVVWRLEVTSEHHTWRKSCNSIHTVLYIPNNIRTYKLLCWHPTAQLRPSRELLEYYRQKIAEYDGEYEKLLKRLEKYKCSYIQMVSSTLYTLVAIMIKYNGMDLVAAYFKFLSHQYACMES